VIEKIKIISCTSKALIYTVIFDISQFLNENSFYFLHRILYYIDKRVHNIRIYKLMTFRECKYFTEILYICFDTHTRGSTTDTRIVKFHARLSRLSHVGNTVKPLAKRARNNCHSLIYLNVLLPRHLSNVNDSKCHGTSHVAYHSIRTSSKRRAHTRTHTRIHIHTHVRRFSN